MISFLIKVDPMNRKGGCGWRRGKAPVGERREASTVTASLQMRIAIRFQYRALSMFTLPTLWSVWLMMSLRYTRSWSKRDIYSAWRVYNLSLHFIYFGDEIKRGVVRRKFICDCQGKLQRSFSNGRHPENTFQE